MQLTLASQQTRKKMLQQVAEVGRTVKYRLTTAEATCRLCPRFRFQTVTPTFQQVSPATFHSPNSTIFLPTMSQSGILSDPHRLSDIRPSVIMVCLRQVNGQRVAESGHLEDPRQVLLRRLLLPCFSFSVGLAINLTIFSHQPSSGLQHPA